VPRVIGLRLPAAKKRIRKAHCSLRAVRRIRARARVGKIVSQRPRAGSLRARGYGLRLAVGRR
jgi:beta-lactam-binding protein with PASTA domain